MRLIKTVRGFTPELGEDCYIAENATIVGNVVAGPRCSFWFNSVVRGDVNSIVLGEQVNVQDGAVIHCTYEKAETRIGSFVSIGHNAMVHGCTIHDHVLIGMGSIVMDGAVIESNSIVAAGAVVTEGMRVEAGTIYAGVPARKVKEVDAEKLSGEIHRIANNYVMYSSWFKSES